MITIRQLPEFRAWLSGIRDVMTRLRLAKRLDKAARGLIVMLGGGDKSTQQADIARAIELAGSLEE